MTNDIQKADTQFRKKLFMFYIIVIAIVTVLFHIFFPIIKSTYAHLPTQYDRDIFLTNLEFIFLLLFTIPTTIMVLKGYTIYKQERYPWIGKRVIVDTKIITGKRAKKLGVTFIIVGVLSTILIITSAFVNNRIVQSFFDNPFKWLTTSDRILLENITQEKQVPSHQ